MARKADYDGHATSVYLINWRDRKSTSNERSPNESNERAGAYLLQKHDCHPSGEPSYECGQSQPLPSDGTTIASQPWA